MFIIDSIKETQEISNISDENINITFNINSTVVVQIRSLEIKKSNVFNENKFKLKMFLTQVELYINFNVNKFNKDQKKYCEHLFISEMKRSTELIHMFEISSIIKIILKIEKLISILYSYFEIILKRN